MNDAVLLLVVSVCFLVGYLVYAKWVANKLGVLSWAHTAILVSAVKSGEMIRLFSSAFLLALAAALVVIAALHRRR